jgi:hypothetical protein
MKYIMPKKKANIVRSVVGEPNQTKMVSIFFHAAMID